LTKGDWKKCSDLILSLKVYNHHKIYSEMRSIILKHIKETALKCYLILYSEQYSSFSLDSLSSRFSIEQDEVRSIINNMILENELLARWSGDTLELFHIEMNVKMIKRLEENLNAITEQNLTLIELTNKVK
jgi:translation initiation factor 3 subunit C